MKPWKSAFLLSCACVLLVWACTTSQAGGEGQPEAGALEPGSLPERWIDGTDENEPLIQVHAYNDDLYILRQSKRSDYEAPFMYLVFGERKAILLDTGSRGSPPLRETVDRIVTDWCERSGRENVHLVVAHTHGHGDHVANDNQFRDRPETTLVSRRFSKVREHFGITTWPKQIVTYDLGNRVLDVIPTPGHHQAHLSFYDRRTGLLITGDTFYPGYLFIFGQRNWSFFRETSKRLAAFAAAHPISHVLGCHIEMARDGKSFRYGETRHPDEHPLQLTVQDLQDLAAAVDRLGDEPEVDRHPHFVILPAWKVDRDFWPRRRGG